MKIAFAIIVVIILGLGGWMFFTGTQVEAPAADTEVRGTVTNVNLEQMAVDGPALISIESEQNITYTVAVPSMGLPLCAARENIADVSDINVGDALAVRGKTNAEGYIIPCEDAAHFLQVTVE